MAPVTKYLIDCLRPVAVGFLIICFNPATALAWGGLGHRTIAAIAMQLIPGKAAQIDRVLQALEIDNNFIDAASYPDEYIRNHDSAHRFNAWHFADLPDNGGSFDCGSCLLNQLPANLSAISKGPDDKKKAIAIAWVLHLVGDLHQPLHLSGRERGGNSFPVTYRGKKSCKLFNGALAKVELHSAWDDCLVEELAHGRSPTQLAKALLGNIKTYKARPEVEPHDDAPWLKWAEDSHVLANTVAFDDLLHGDDLNSAYIVGEGRALEVVHDQLLKAGIRLAMLLDQNFPNNSAKTLDTK